MEFQIPDEIVKQTQLTESELKVEIAVMLFQRDKFTLAQSARFAGMTRLEFQRLLASRKIPLHYTIQDFRDEVDTLRKTGFL